MPRLVTAARRWLAAAALVASACADARPPIPEPIPAAVPAITPARPPEPPAPTVLPRLPAEAAIEVIDLGAGAALLTQHAEVLDRPILPASVAKAFVLRAALDGGALNDDTRIACRGTERIDGRLLECGHPRLSRPLSAVDALAHSCNSFFVAIASRLPWPRVVSAMQAAGVPAGAPVSSPRLAMLGLDGSRASPRQWLRAFVRLVNDASVRGGPGDRILLAGLRQAARAGTAMAFAEHGVDALAKTGSGRVFGGAPGGLVVAVSPADAPRHAVVVVGAGIAGRTAAEIGAFALRHVAAGAGSAARTTADSELRVGIARAQGYEVRSVALEDYIAGVVAAEAPAGAPAQAREALAIAARSYVVAHPGRHFRDGFDLCDLTHCQAFHEPDAPSRDAARATVGLIAVRGGRVEPGYHSASCGGSIALASEVWDDPDGRAEGAAARPDPSAHEPYEPWQSEISAADLTRTLRTIGHRGDGLTALAVLARTSSGRVRTLSVPGLLPGEIDGETFRLAVGRTLGWQHLKSSLYDVTRSARGHRFSGRGRGHGVGLCVAGGVAFAARGAAASSILEAYFPGAATMRWDTLEGTLTALRLPALDEKDRNEVEGIVRAARRAVSRQLGVRQDAPLRITFHASVRDYQKASGQPWWTAGATRDGRIDLLPLDTLRKQGTLERTVRHEMVHALTAEALAGQPRWAGEGIAHRVADPAATVTPRDATCPADHEFGRAASASGLARVYERARACVDRAVAAAGGDWRQADWKAHAAR